MKRFLSAVLAFVLSAQPALAAGGQRSVPLPKTGGLTLGSVRLPSISLQSIPNVSVPTLPALSAPSLPTTYGNSVRTEFPYIPTAQAVAPQANPLAPVPVAQRVTELAQSVHADAAVLPNLGGEASKGVVDAQIAKLTGVGETTPSGALPVSTPETWGGGGRLSSLKHAFSRDGEGGGRRASRIPPA